MATSGGGGSSSLMQWRDLLVPESLSAEITPILFVANELESTNYRIASLCRFYALYKAHLLDPGSNGRGVRQFKTFLVQRLEKDDAVYLFINKEMKLTFLQRLEKDGVMLLEYFYLTYRDYIKHLDKADRERCRVAYQIADVLFEFLEAIDRTQGMEVRREILETHEKTHMYAPFNILPLGPAGADQAVMRIPEIKAAVIALRNKENLPLPDGYENKNVDDILDWLQAYFRFQNDNVANQREHLILLLANAQMRRHQRPKQHHMDYFALNEVIDKLFDNYRRWCDHLHCISNIRGPCNQAEQRRLLYTALYLLIWGEAANLRLMPECLSYIFHHMAGELHQIVKGFDSSTKRSKVKPAYGGESGAFLKKVVSPIYAVIAKEAALSQGGKLKHSQWRNYDDLNEYFWSVDCFQLGWPMRADADFFSVPVKSSASEENVDDNSNGSNRRAGKVNFVEKRSFFHVFRSFDRMWSFFILCLQAMIIVAWNGHGKLTRMLDPPVFKRVLTVFITAPVLKLFQVVLDVIFNWEARHCMPFNVKLRYLLKIIYAAIWVVILPVTYEITLKGGYPHTVKGWFGTSSGSPSPFIMAVAVYMSPNILPAVLLLFPSIRRRFDSSNHRIVMIIRRKLQYFQPRLYVGSGMHESTWSFLKYTTFWILLMMGKLAFSYHYEIKPLVGPTKAIMKVDFQSYNTWHRFFPQARNNINVVVALWAPVILVYFMDTIIWYAIFSTVVGGIYGALRRLGEIRTLGTLRSRFESLPGAFNGCLCPGNQVKKKSFIDSLLRKHDAITPHKGKETSTFAQFWNAIVTSFREEDLINNREMNLLLFPKDQHLELIQWPLFLLASMIPSALDMAKDSNFKDCEVIQRNIGNDSYMSIAIRESYALFSHIIKSLVCGECEKKVINDIFKKVDKHIEDETLMMKLNMSALPKLYNHVVKLISYLLTNNQKDRDEVVILFQDIHEVVTMDIMEDQCPNLDEPGYERDEHSQLFALAGAILFPIPESDAWKEKVNRLYLLLTVKESAVDVPSNLEARRRLCFFSNSLFMEMPPAPEVRKMLSFSVLTPYYKEEVLYSLPALEVPNEDGVSILFYLQKVFPDEWDNFLERLNCADEDDLKRNGLEDDICLWASYRGQTLTKTVRGMMYYRKALELQAHLDGAKDDGMEVSDEHMNVDELLSAEEQGVLPDIKFTYVVSCQQYGIQKRNSDLRAQNVLRLMTEYPSLRVAYIDEVVEPTNDATVFQKVYYSVLVKAMPNSSASKTGQNLDQIIYKIKLPGPPILGEGKPENQNHAIIFTRGEGLQTIDMNQDNYMEEALKMRNLLQEFLKKHGGVRYPTILGLREHIFTGSVSSLAWFMSNQETSFVTLGQRLLANPLKVRFHYGHPDVFDRLFHLTRGGVSKASKIINLSEDIFSGFNSTLREGNITHHEYIQVGKGRDVALNQISLFEAKVANGNGEQTLSRDVYRLGHHLDFFRMLSCYFTTIGFYFSTLITVVTVYVFLYGRLYLVLNGLEEGLASQTAILGNKSFQVAIASQCFMQIGILMGLPMLVQNGLERGIWTAFCEFILMQLQLAPVFFTFLLGTKAHYYGRTLLHGGAKYMATGRGFGVGHAKFAENYRLYSRSHFVKGIELMILLIVYRIFGQLYRGTVAYLSITISMWFMVSTWLFAPFLFNPSGFEWQKIVDDWSDWNKWISNKGGIGVPAEKSWESWWEEELEHLQYSGKFGAFVEMTLSLRFFIFQYGFVYHLSMAEHLKERTFFVFFLSWLVIIAYIVMVKGLSFARMKLSVKFEIIFRVIKGLIFLSVMVILIVVCHMTLQDIGVFILAFMPTGWGILQIAQGAGKPVVKKLGLWGSLRTLARVYEELMGLLVFAPVAILAWFPFVSEFQSRILFNQAFSRGLQISRILGGHRKDRFGKKKK